MRHGIPVLLAILIYHLPISLESVVANINFALLPFYFHYELKSDFTSTEMRSPSIQPSSQSFRANLKELSATDHTLQRQNFDLKMENFHLRARLTKAKKEQIRRESYATPKADKFYYEEENESDSTEEFQTNHGDDQFENDNQVIKALQDKLVEQDNLISRLEDENKSLWDARDDLNGSLTKQSSELEELKATRDTLQAKADGAQLQMGAVVRAMEEAQNQANEKHKEVAEVRAQIKDEQTRATSASKNFENERVLRQMAESRFEEEHVAVKNFRVEISSLKRERDNAMQNLRAEEERRDIWEATRGLGDAREEYLASDSQPMESLLSRLDEKRTQFEQETEYKENWRDNVNEYLKECMKALYSVELEVDAKRRNFLGADCMYLNSAQTTST